MIVVRCERGGLAGYHRWEWVDAPEYTRTHPVFDRKCVRCGRWYIDVIEQKEVNTK